MRNFSTERRPGVSSEKDARETLV